MGEILFVTNRNVTYTCGELRLIKNRAITLWEEFGIKSDFIAFNKIRSDAKEEIGAESTMTAFLYNRKNPIDYISKWSSFKKAVLSAIKDKNYKVVVLSGVFALRLAKKIKKSFPNVAVIADVHGALEELIEFPKKGFVKKTLFTWVYYYFKHIEKKGFKYVDGCFVVSNSLKNYLGDEYGVNKPCYIIPCAVRKQIISQDNLETKRKTAREKYGIAEDEMVFVYSGGVSSWQCIEESVALYKKLSEKMDTKTRLLVLSSNLDYIKKFQAQNVIIDSLPAAEVTNVLPIADYAFMLRKKAVTNAVAYPNKFLEYVLSGLKVITTPFVDDVAKQTAEYKLGYIVENVDEALTNDLALYCKDNLEKTNPQSFIDEVCFENRLKTFVKEYFN